MSDVSYGGTFVVYTFSFQICYTLSKWRCVFHCFFLFFQDQYIFIHDAILESVTCGDTEIEAGDLRKRLAQLKTRDESGRSGLDLQFAVRLLLTVHANNPRNCPSGLDGKFPLRV